MDQQIEPESVAPSSGAALPLAGPWRRYGAFYIDFIAVGVPIALLTAPVIANLANAGGVFPVALFSSVLMLFVLQVLAVVFRIFGNTPGKALFGLQVITSTGNRPTYSQYARRQWGVFVYGLWMGTPFFSFIGSFLQFRRVIAERPAAYDEGKFNVIARPIGRLRIAIFVFLGASLVIGHSYIQSLGTWKNPTSGMKAALPEGWAVREFKRDNDEPGHIFASSRRPEIGMLWRRSHGDEAAATHSLQANARTLVAQGLSRVDGQASNGRAVTDFGGSKELDAKMRPVKITLWQDGADVWQLLIMGEPGGVVDAEAARELRSVIVGTVSRPRAQSQD